MKPSEHKTVQARILKYAQDIGWTFVSREEAEVRRGFDPEAAPKDRARGVSLFFDDLLDAKVRKFNPRYTEAKGALLGKFRHFHPDIYGNREFVDHLRNRGKFFDHEEKRERDLSKTKKYSMKPERILECTSLRMKTGQTMKRAHPKGTLSLRSGARDQKGYQTRLK